MGSVAVGQQRLVEAPPVRRLIVPRGHSSWWGVDPSTSRVAVAYVDCEGSRGAATVPFARLEGPGRLSEIYAQTRHFVKYPPAEFPHPGVVLIEQPSGKFENPNLSYAVGVIQAAVYDGLRDLYGEPVRVEMVVAQHWKLVACGAGNLYKPKRRDGYYGVLSWARQNGYAGSSWDEADALGIAECARREIALGER